MNHYVQTVASREEISLVFDYVWFQNIDDVYLYDTYDYYDNGVTYNWFQIVMYNFVDKKWRFLAPLPLDNCKRCTDYMPVTSVTYIDKRGKM